MIRPTAIAAALLTSAVPAVSHHDAKVPRDKALARVYDDLLERTQADPQGFTWHRFRMRAHARWKATHPAAQRRHMRWRCSTAGLRAIARRAGYWPAVEATWECERVPAWKRAFLRCIPRYEGGRHPDTRYGGARGYAGLESAGNVVLGPWQVRPGWVQGWIATGRLSYGRDRWDWRAYQAAIDPVTMARIVARITPAQYATAGRCL